MFNFDRVVLSPSSSCVAAKKFEMLEGIRIPTTEGLYDKGLEGYALSSAVVKMAASFCRFPHFDGGCGRFRSAKDDGLLRGRNNTDIAKE